MDLSRLKWPVIIVVVIGFLWLLSDGGISFMHKRFTSEKPGVSASRDEINEAGLTRVAAFLLFTFRYSKAYGTYEDALRLYPEGRNALTNRFRMATCAERLGRPRESMQILQSLMIQNAHAKDERVPSNDVLKLRTDKLAEINDLGEVGGKRY